MKIKTTVLEKVAVVKLSGRLNQEAVMLIEDETRELLGTGYDRMVFNMIDVSDLGSSGLGKLLALKRTLEGRGGTFVISEPSPVVEYIMDLAGLGDAFYVYPSDARAVEAISPRN